MAAPFVHLEVLGPRATLDRWLAVLQDHGGCHVADALSGLEGESGIARPHATVDERRGAVLRSEAALVLNGVERFLPPSAAGEDTSARPAWTVGPGGRDEVDVEDLLGEARVVGGRLREALEEARSAEHVVAACDTERGALDTFSAAGAETTEGLCFATSRMRSRRLVRALTAAGWKAAAGTSGSEQVVVAAGDGTPVPDAIATARARVLELSDDLAGQRLPEARLALDARREPARRRLEEALAALRRRIDEDGGRARVLLDALEDAEARAESWRHIASTEHVTAARVFVRPEDRDALHSHLGHAFGREVVVRELDPEPPDMPVLPRGVAGLPFAALEGLRPSLFGEIATPSLLALFVPLATGAVLADLAGGIILLLVGALIGAGAPLGSPRRDTALLAQAGGLMALVFGILAGRAFGTAGAAWFGTDWGLASGAPAFLAPSPLTGLVLRLGGLALAFALWGGICAAIELRRGRGTRARTALVGALSFLAVAGGAALALSGGEALRWAWILAPLSALAILLLAGPRAGFGRLVLDLVGVVRCAAIGLLALVLFAIGFAMLAHPSTANLVMAPAVLVLAALAVVVDPAYVAMGVPYDLSLGTRALGQPFTPFTRHVVRGRSVTARRGMAS